MKNKKFAYLAFLFIVCIINISAVSAAEDSTSDIISADNAENLFLEENINEDVIANNNEELHLEENNEENAVLDEGNENENYTESSAKVTLDITAVDTSINITAVDIIYGEEAVINFTVKDNQGNGLNGNLKVNIAGMNKTVPVENGFGSITIANLNAGRHNIIANYLPNESYAGSIAMANFNVAKLGTQIIYSDMNTKAVSTLDPKTGEWFKWTLLDANGKPMANIPMEIGFNGVVYDEKNGIVTDENGNAKLQINLGYKGTYTFAICYLGDENHNASFVVAKITVKEQTPTLTVPNKSYKATDKTKSLTATFKTAKGTVVANKKVSFTVNGKTYSAKTNAKGVATVNVSLNKKGTYKVNAKFAGDSTYAAVTKTATLQLT